jgi:hypothetical protein
MRILGLLVVADGDRGFATCRDTQRSHLSAEDLVPRLEAVVSGWYVWEREVATVICYGVIGMRLDDQPSAHPRMASHSTLIGSSGFSKVN